MVKKVDITYGSVSQSKSGRRVGYISINSHTIRRNAQTGSNDPPIRIARSQSDKKPVYASSVTITGPSRLLYSPDAPIMGCGARLVLVASYSDIKPD